jgi:hypothetical protein
VVKGPGVNGAAGAARPDQRSTDRPPTDRPNGTATANRPERRGGRKREHEPKSAFATELAKVL